MLKNLLYSFILLLLTSCSPRINYLGSSTTPTSRVDVFVNEAAIKKNYDIVGKGYPHYGSLGKKTIEKIQSKAVEKAKEKGADAVLIQDYYVPDAGRLINTVIRQDSIAKGTITAKNTFIQSTGNSGYTIYFLKYSK